MKQKIHPEPERFFIYDFAFSMSAYYTCGGAIIAGLTDYLNLSLPLSSAVLSIPTILLVMQLFGGYVYNSTSNRYRFLKTLNLIWRPLVPVVFLSVLLPRPTGGLVMVVSYIVMTGTYQFVTPAQNAWLVDCTEGRVKESFYPLRETIFIVLYTALIFIYGVIIELGLRLNLRAESFVIVGIAEALLLVASIFILTRRMEPPPETIKRQNFGLLSSLMGVLRDKRYRNFLLFNTFWNVMGVFVPNFFALYEIRILKLDYIFVVLCTTLGNICRSVSVPLFARLAHKIGWKKTALSALLLMCVATLCCPLVNKDNAWLLVPFVAVLLAVPYGGVGIGFFRMQIFNSPSDLRSTYFAVNAAICGFAAFLGSTLCSSVTSFLERSFEAPPFQIIFYIGLVSLLLTIFFFRRTPFEKD